MGAVLSTSAAKAAGWFALSVDSTTLSFACGTVAEAIHVQEPQSTVQAKWGPSPHRVGPRPVALLASDPHLASHCRTGRIALCRRRLSPRLDRRLGTASLLRLCLGRLELLRLPRIRWDVATERGEAMAW